MNVLSTWFKRFQELPPEKQQAIFAKLSVFRNDGFYEDLSVFLACRLPKEDLKQLVEEALSQLQGGDSRPPAWLQKAALRIVAYAYS